MNIDIDQALQTFIAESRELLEDMERALLSVTHVMDQSEAIAVIFRAAHTIKGSAGLFGLDHIVAFTHLVESAIDEVREGRIAVEGGLVTLLLSCCDHMASMINIVAEGNMESDEVIESSGESLVEQLRAYVPSSRLTVVAPFVVAAHSQGQALDTSERISEDDGSSDHWHISLRFGRDVLRNGLDPLSFIRYLSRIGRIVAIATLPDAIPEAAEMDPESCYLGFEIAFDTDADRATIDSVFEFVHDSCEIRILPPHSKISAYLSLIEQFPGDEPRLGEILLRCGSVTERELAAVLNQQAHANPLSKPVGSLLVEQGLVSPEIVAAALSKQRQIGETKSQEASSIRVSVDKLDHLINLVGDLIITGARTNLIAHRMHHAELQECASTLSGLLQEVRDSTLQLRMVKIGATFNRFQRVVHDVARDIGKDIGLVVSGEDIDLDKIAVEKIGDPLTHLVRNAIDHGIESAELRMRRGKPTKGTVKLNAYRDSGSVVIEVSDDGGGLKRDLILAKAVDSGLVIPGCKLSDSEIYNLIFQPGFSSVEKITNLSGRGLGLDIVKSNITALRGSVTIDSTEGVGTTVTMRLPLKLAIIDGLLASVGKLTFVVPFDVIDECIEYSAEAGQEYTTLRGKMLPFIRMRAAFGIDEPMPRRQSIMVVKHEGERVGLVVDALLGEYQTVIKPLSPTFSKVGCLSGSTILGNGDVAPILDVAALLHAGGNAEIQQLVA